MKVWVIGHVDPVLGFALVGVHGQAVDSVQSMNQALDAALANPDLGLVLVTEDCSNLASERMSRLKSRIESPLFLEIPSPKGTNGKGTSFIGLAEQAIGIRK